MGAEDAFGRTRDRKRHNLAVAVYPRWRFFPASSPPPTWVQALADIFANHKSEIDSMVDHQKRMQSNDVLAVLAADLQEQAGFQVESGKKAAGKLNRPVFFGDEGEFLRKYEIDAFHPELGVALEVEAGRATMEMRSIET